MRVLVDTNIYVSRLLIGSRSFSGVARLIDAAILGEYTLLLPEEALDELRGLRERKAYLRDRITQRDVDDLIRVLQGVSVILPRQAHPIPAVLRDPKDDFLLTAAVLENADYLVTGDRDILDIRNAIVCLSVVTVAEFLALLPSSHRE